MVSPHVKGQGQLEARVCCWMSVGGSCNQGITWDQEAEPPAGGPSRNKLPVDLVIGSTSPGQGDGGAQESRARWRQLLISFSLAQELAGISTAGSTTVDQAVS